MFVFLVYFYVNYYIRLDSLFLLCAHQKSLPPFKMIRLRSQTSLSFLRGSQTMPTSERGYASLKPVELMYLE